MVLVTGGTGLVGTHLLLRLLRKNISVRSLFREGSNLENVKKIFGHYTSNAPELFEKIDWVKADLNNIPDLEIAFEGVDRVYHCAALISFDPGDYNILKKTNIEGTANIVNLCIAKHIEKICYVSTIGTIGKSLDGSSANEETEWTDQDVNVYALTKYRAEMEVWRGSQEGIETIIVNPGVILGPGFWGSGSGAFFTTAQKGYSYYPPGGTGFVTVDDVTTIMTDLMDSNLKNERYIVVAENLKFKKILGMIAKPLGKRIPNKELKHWQLQTGRFFDWLFNIYTGRGRRLTKNTIISLYQRDAYDNSKIKKALDFDFSPLEPTVQFCCEKFKEECLAS